MVSEVEFGGLLSAVAIFEILTKSKFGLTCQEAETEAGFWAFSLLADSHSMLACQSIQTCYLHNQRVMAKKWDVQTRKNKLFGFLKVCQVDTRGTAVYSTSITGLFLFETAGYSCTLQNSPLKRTNGCKSYDHKKWWLSSMKLGPLATVWNSRWSETVFPLSLCLTFVSSTLLLRAVLPPLVPVTSSSPQWLGYEVQRCPQMPLHPWYPGAYLWGGPVPPHSPHHLLCGHQLSSSAECQDKASSFQQSSLITWD